MENVRCIVRLAKRKIASAINNVILVLTEV